MVKMEITLISLILLCSLTGCLGGDRSDDLVEADGIAHGDVPPPLGEWYYQEDLVANISEDGSLVTGEGESGTWSTNNSVITTSIEINEDNEFNYSVEGDWLWLKAVADDECQPLSSEPISEDEWDARVSEQTPASFC